MAAWARQRRCEDTFDPGIHDAVTEAVRAHADPGAAIWGMPPGTFYRVANGTQVDGWNRMSAPRVKAPILVVVGEHDPRSAEEVPNLHRYRLDGKILLKMQCATHFLLFERNHKTVHNAFAEFLTKGTVNGRRGVSDSGSQWQLPSVTAHCSRPGSLSQWAHGGSPVRRRAVHRMRRCFTRMMVCVWKGR